MDSSAQRPTGMLYRQTPVRGSSSSARRLPRSESSSTSITSCERSGCFRRDIAVCGDVVDFSCPSFIGRRNLPATRSGRKSRYGWRQSATVYSDRFTVGVIFRRAFFQHQTELFPEGFGIFPRRLSPVFQHLPRTRLVRRYAGTRYRAVLQGISRETFSGRSLESVSGRARARIVRHELLGIVHNERALYVRLQTMFVIAVPESRHTATGYTTAGVLLLAFRGCGSGHGGSVKSCAILLVKLVVLVVFNFDLLRVTTPEPC